MTRYLVDNSVLQRLPRSAEVQAAVAEMLEEQHDLCSCAATVDEFAFSARSAGEQAEAVRRLRTSFLYLPMNPAIDEIVVDIRKALFVAGHGRAAGVIDVQIASTAIFHDATVLHYGSDYDHVATAYPTFSARWIVPRGTID